MSININWHGRENTWIVNFFPESSPLKIGIINWWVLEKEDLLIENIEKFVDQNDVTLFYSDEIIYNYALQGFNYNYNELFSLLNRKNVFYIFFDDDFSSIVKPDKNKVLSVPWFFKNPLYIDTNTTIDIEYRPKKFVFNMLCGSIRSYRSILFKVLKDNTQIYSTYYGHPKYKHDNFSNELDESDIVNILQNSKITDTRIDTMVDIYRQGRRYILSHVVPTTIYNNSHFDIVCETFVKDDHIFLSEKTAKPLATGRFFCWHSSSKLRNYLSKFGFSFDTYYNSYDNALDSMTRIDAMLDDVIKISNNQNLVKTIYAHTRHERIHNMEMYKKNFDDFSIKLSQWIELNLK